MWPLWNAYPNLNLYADELMRLVQAYGATHVGIGTDMDGLGRSTLPSYAEFAELPGYLAKRGLNEAGIEVYWAGTISGRYARRCVFEVVSAPTCPLCGRPNECVSARTGSFGERCWCESVTFSPGLLARVPEDKRNVACICRACATEAEKPG